VGSDGLYLFCSALSLLALLWVDDGWAERRPVASAALVTLILMLSVSTRAAGMAFPVTFGLWEAARAFRVRRLRPYALWTAGLLACTLILYDRLLYSGASQYSTQFKLQPLLMLRNAVFYLRMAAPLWTFAPTL